MLIDNLFAAVLFFLSIYCAAAKHSLIEGIIESEKSFATTGDYNLTALMNDTFDGLLLENFIKVFNADPEILSNAKDRLGNNTLSKNLNFNALRYFLYVQSQLIDQIENPFSSNKQSLEALNFDFQFSEDQELTNYIKINFLALMEFWKEYICIYHSDSKKSSLKIHDTYVRLISSIFSTVTSKNNTYSITPFEWIKSFCKCTVDKASIFLNPAHLIAKTIQKDFGIMPPNIGINENTKTNLPSSFYYTPQAPQAENFAANTNEVAGGPVNTATPGGTLGADGNPVQNVGNEAINPADNQFGPNPEANPNPNINGIRNGGGWFGNWFGFLGNFWNKDKKANEEPSIIKYNEDIAKETNNSQIYYQLAATYIFGDQKHGILPNRTKALMYLTEASNRGHSEAMYNLGVMNLEEDLNTSYKWFQKCAAANFSLCFKGLAVIYGYNHPNNTYFNMTKSEEYFDLAINLGVETNALEKLKQVATYFVDPTMFGNFTNCKKIYKLMKDIITIGTSDIHFLYNLGYKKYTMGQIDSALIIFSFCAMTGHKEAVKAASFIWSNNLTKNLTCKLKDSRLCAFFFDMQLLFLNENIGGLNAARIRHQIHEMKNSFNDKIEFVKTQFDKLSFEIYDYLSDRNSEATFNQAMMLYQGIGTNKNTTRAFEIWENMIESSLNGNISLNNFAPALLAKSYYSAKEIFQ